jgi:hypothetical protein
MKEIYGFKEGGINSFWVLEWLFLLEISFVANNYLSCSLSNI